MAGLVDRPVAEQAVLAEVTEVVVGVALATMVGVVLVLLLQQLFLAVL
jgi:hypothetical protein